MSRNNASLEWVFNGLPYQLLKCLKIWYNGLHIFCFSSKNLDMFLKVREARIVHKFCKWWSLSLVNFSHHFVAQ